MSENVMFGIAPTRFMNFRRNKMKHLKGTAALLAAVMMLASCGEEANKPADQANGSGAQNSVADPFGGAIEGAFGDAIEGAFEDAIESIADELPADFQPNIGETTNNNEWTTEATTTEPETEPTTTTTTAPLLVSGDGLIVRERYSNFGQLNNGYAFMTEGNTYYVTNMKGEITLEMKQPENAYYNYKLLKSGNLLNYKDYREFRSTRYAYGTNVIMYGADGAELMSPEKNGFDRVILSNDDYFFVLKNDTGFDGDTHYFGTINMSGEWVKELTAVDDEFNYDSINYWAYVNGAKGNGYVVAPLANGGIALIDITKCKVVFKTDEKYNNENSFRYSRPSETGWYLDSNMLYAIGDGKYNVLTGEFTSWKEFTGLDKTVFDDRDRNFKTETWYYDNFYYGYYSIYDRKDYSTAYDYYLFDKELNKSIPLNDYKVYDKSYIGYKGGNAVLAAKGKDSGVYLCVVNSEGKYVFNPIRLGKQDDRVYFDYFKIFDNYVVYVISGEKTINFVDMTGNVISQSFEGEFKAYDYVTGVYAVEMSDNDVCFFGTDGTQQLQVTRAER